MLALLNPMTILGVLLALSLIGNGVLYKIHTNDLQRIGGLKQATKEARADAQACSDGVKKLREAGVARDKHVAEALKVAEAKAHAADARADAILQERPINENLCDSALELNQRKLRERHP